MKNRKNIPVLFPTGIPGDTHLSDIRMDPLGSYTGVPENPYEIPVQDADDL